MSFDRGELGSLIFSGGEWWSFDVAVGGLSNPGIFGHGSVEGSTHRRGDGISSMCWWELR